jgi:hypothetical protein
VQYQATFLLKSQLRQLLVNRNYGRQITLSSSVKIADKTVPRVWLSTTPWRRRGRAGTAPRFLLSAPNAQWGVSFTPRPLYLGEGAPGTHWTGSWYAHNNTAHSISFQPIQFRVLRSHLDKQVATWSATVLRGTWTAGYTTRAGHYLLRLSTRHLTPHHNWSFTLRQGPFRRLSTPPSRPSLINN